MQWMIKKFLFRNVGPFEKEIVLDLTAKLNDEGKELIRFSAFDRKILKFNKIIGIFGPNASGKTKILDVIIFYLRYNSLESHPTLFSDFFWNINNIRDVFCVEAIITNGYEEIHHEIKFDPQNFFMNTRKDGLSNLIIKNSFSELIYLVDLKTQEEIPIYNNDYRPYQFNNNKYKFIEYVNFVYNSIGDSENIFKDPLFGQYFNPHTLTISNEKGKDSLVGFQDHFMPLLEKEKNEKKVYDALNSVCHFEINNSHAFKQNYDFGYTATPRRLNQLVDKLIKQGYSEKKISTYLTNIARICDQKVKEIKVTNRAVRSNFDLKKLKLNQNNTYDFDVEFFDRELSKPLNVLSSGTLNLIIIFLELLNLNKYTDGHHLIIIDELGQSWHSSMTTNFLNFLDKSQILTNSTIIFTSHQPEIGNFMRKDAVWIVDRNHALKPLFSFKNPLTNADISRLKFSKVYYDEVFDVFQTNPSITDFLDSNLNDYFEDEKS